MKRTPSTRRDDSPHQQRHRTSPSHPTTGHEITMQVVERHEGPQYTITIPRPIAQAMGYKKGDILRLSIQKGNIVLSPVPTKE